MQEKRKQNSNVPNLRFPEFEGEWEEIYLENICNKIGDGIHSTPEYDDFGDYFFINGNNLVDGRIKISELTKKVSRKEAEKYNSNNLLNNTLFISINGTIGSLALYNNEPVMLGKSVCYINPKLSQNAKFIFYQLDSKRVYNYFISELTGTTIKNLSLKSIRNTVLYIPLQEEQTKIAYLLQLINTRISTQIQIIEELKTLIKGLIHSFVRNKEVNIQLRDCLNCHSSTLMENAVIEKNGTYPVYGATGIIANTPDYEIDKDAILIIKDGASVGKVQYAKGKYSVIGTLNYLTSKENVSLKYLYYYLQSFNFDKYKVGSGIPHIYFKDYGDKYIYCPTIEKQNKIANFLSAIDEKLETEKHILAKYIEQKKHLLQQMFI
jgi:type I restriction enzyme S subunit